MTCSGHLDLHTDSGYRRLTGEEDDEVKGYGMRGMNVLRKGTARDGRQVIHMLDSICKSHRLQVRSSYGAELLAAAHSLDEAYPTIVTLHELRTGSKLSSEQLKLIRERGGLTVKVTLTTDAESCYKSCSSTDTKIPTEKTLMGHVSWIREMLRIGIVTEIQWVRYP